MPEAAKPAVVAAFAVRHPAPVLFLAPSPSRAQSDHEELGLLLDSLPLARLPERERLPYELARDDDALGLERSRALAILRGPGPGLVVASWTALAEHCAPPSVGALGLDVTSGGVAEPASLLRQLEAIGYVREPLADRPGTAARRGGIVDIFPAGAESPLRLEFFGSQVESIRLIDLGTQRSRERIDRVHVPPLGTGTERARDEAARLAGRLEASGEESESFIEELQKVAEGARSDYSALIESLVYDSTALDHLAPGALVIFDEADEGKAALAAAAEHQERARVELERRGAIPAGLPSLTEDPEVLAARLEALRPATHLSRYGTDELGSQRLPLAPAPSFAGRLKPLVIQCRDWAREGRAVVVASQQALRIGDLALEEGIETSVRRRVEAAPAPGSITLVPLAVGGGFSLGDRLMLVSDTEIFGFRKRRRPSRRRPGIREDIVSTLEVGDYLVHSDHGIARFGGLMRRTIDAVEREYLELQYAEGDRLFVPVDQLDAVSRYVGPADRPPSLTRLGTQEWARAKRRVRQAIAEIAGELLDLYARRELARGHAFGPDNPWQMEMEAAFPFVETADQLEAIAEVKADMQTPRPMDRLICGDVGYGKTEVAIRAAFKAVMDGKQVAVLVPTTVLAEQHGETFRERTAGFPVRVEVLSRFRSPEEQREIVAGISSGAVDVAIGTHRLLQRDVAFRDLGLVVIDEEQRFGVAHKERLKQMRAEVDVISMSATPIPRTLQMSLSGIRDMSSVMTPPEERLPIRTYVTEWDDEILREAIEREMGRGGQVYFVHNRVHSIERVMGRVRRIVPEADIAVAHGQMPEEQLERVMLEFAAGEHDILVCTTIIESGLDIPNVNTIVIDDANRLGLAQLYQLRGRVGRGANRAYAYLLYDRNRAISETAQKRLEAVFEATELGAGFQIALRDLEIRGAGNVLGAEQSGYIAAVGFEMYSRLLGEAVASLRSALKPGQDSPPSLPPAPPVDLPLSAHVPASYIEDMHARLAVYQRIAAIESAEQVSEMEAELRDRFGPVPPSIENLLYVQLLRALARRARVESIGTDEHMFHVRVGGGVGGGQRARIEALGEKGVLVGPNQVRIDRTLAGSKWMPLLVRILRTLEQTGAADRQPAAVG